MVSDTPKFIDFIGVDRFYSIVSFFFGRYLQFHEDQEKINSSWFVYSIDELQVWKENQWAQAFKVFVYLERKISDFKDELEDEFVSSGGV